MFKNPFLTLFTIAMFLSMTPPSYAEVVDKILAVVNDQIITQSDIKDLSKKIKGNGLLDEALLELYDRKKINSSNEDLLKYLIDERIVDSEVTRLGLFSPVEQVEAKIRDIAKARRIDLAQLRVAIKNEGITFSDYQAFIKTTLQRQNLIQKEVSSKIKISDEDIYSYYIQNYGNTQSLTYEYSLSHIIFLKSNGGAPAAKKKADDVAAALAKGTASFESIAAQKSEDPDFVQGGVFGKYKLSDLNATLANVVKAMSVADVSSTIDLPDSYRILKVTKKTLVPSPDFIKKRDQIRAIIMTEQFKKQFRAWLDQKRKESSLQING
jgi:peptidyl-prolyl cis-trans isomerase SurA